MNHWRNREDVSPNKPKYLTRLNQVSELDYGEQELLQPVTEKFIFRSNDYYNSLIDWDDPNDPIRRIIIPDVQELDDWGQLDASDEESYTVAKGIEHKYDSTALLLVNEVCAAYCRFCFRKRLFMDDNEEVTKDISEGLAYIKAHPEINNVLLTGGDPLIMSTSKLEPIIRQLREVDHVRIIRIGTKIPAFNPMRLYNDPTLQDMLKRYSTREKRIYIMAHFNHPRELTPQAIRGLEFLLEGGAIVVNQTPMIAGVNDDPDVLGRLFNELSFMGVPPYYVFHCRPTLGNRAYTLPLEQAYEIFEAGRTRVSGLGKRARFVMSHSTGKIEVVGLTQRHICFRYQRAAVNENSARFLVFKRNPEAYWFDDYNELVDEGSILGPEGLEEWTLDGVLNPA